MFFSRSLLLGLCCNALLSRTSLAKTNIRANQKVRKTWVCDESHFSEWDYEAHRQRHYEKCKYYWEDVPSHAPVPTSTPTSSCECTSSMICTVLIVHCNAFIAHSLHIILLIPPQLLLLARHQVQQSLLLEHLPMVRKIALTWEKMFMSVLIVHCSAFIAHPLHTILLIPLQLLLLVRHQVQQRHLLEHLPMVRKIALTRENMFMNPLSLTDLPWFLIHSSNKDTYYDPNQESYCDANH